MATVAARPLSQPISVRTYDRAFYSSIAIVMALTALVGFGPTSVPLRLAISATEGWKAFAQWAVGFV